MNRETIGNLAKGYLLYSASTRLPYVEYYKEGRCNRIFLYEDQKDAEKAAITICRGGDLVGPAELATGDVKEHLMRAPFLGVDALYYKGAGEKGANYKLSDILPDPAKEHVVQDRLRLEDVRLTGIFYAQYLAKKGRNEDRLANYARAFGASLVRAVLLVPVVPKEGHEQDEDLKLADCKLSTQILTRKDNGEQFVFYTLFTNMEEVNAFCKENLEQIRVLRVPVKDILYVMNDTVAGCLIDPLSINIPLRKTDMEMLFGE